MELTVLGCSGSYGAPGGGACSGYLLRTEHHVDLGRLRQRHVQPPAGAPEGRGPHRGRAHPRASRPLRRHLRPPRVAALRHRPREPAGVRARGAREVPARHSSATGATCSTGARSATATPRRIGDIDLRFSRTDHPPPTYAVEARADGRRLIYTADTGPGWSVDAFEPGADLVLSEATYLARQRARADPPLGEAGRRSGARGDGAASDPHPPLAADRSRSCGRGGR